MNALSVLKADYEKKRQDSGLVYVPCPELETGGIKVYTYPTQNGFRTNKCLQARETLGPIPFFVEVLINFALDGAGKHLFPRVQFDDLQKETDNDVIVSLGAAIAAVAIGEDYNPDEAAKEEMEAVAKNSETTKN